MKLLIEIADKDFQALQNVTMSVNEMYNSLKGRIYCAVVAGKNFGMKPKINDKGHLTGYEPITTDANVRLIDANALKEAFKNEEDSEFTKWTLYGVCSTIDEAPTVITTMTMNSESSWDYAEGAVAEEIVEPISNR